MAIIIGSAIGFMIVLFVVLTLAAFLCVIEERVREVLKCDLENRNRRMK